jgi:hypothetical protein
MQPSRQKNAAYYFEWYYQLCILCIIVLFGIFFFDDAIKEPGDLVKRTQLPLIRPFKYGNGFA